MGASYYTPCRNCGSSKVMERRYGEPAMCAGCGTVLTWRGPPPAVEATCAMNAHADGPCSDPQCSWPSGYRMNGAPSVEASGDAERPALARVSDRLRLAVVAGGLSPGECETLAGRIDVYLVTGEWR